MPVAVKPGPASECAAVWNLVCNSVHVPAQAMNSINPGVKRWKEPSLIAFFGQLHVAVLYAIFVGFDNTYGDFGPLSPFTVACLVCPKNWKPDKQQVMRIVLAPP